MESDDVQFTENYCHCYQSFISFINCDSNRYQDCFSRFWQRTGIFLIWRPVWIIELFKVVHSSLVIYRSFGYLLTNMAFLELAENCDDIIKDAFQKLVRFEKRVTRSIGALTTALNSAAKDDRIAFE